MCAAIPGDDVVDMVFPVECLPTAIKLRAILTARKGTIQKNPRVGNMMPFNFTVGERFSVLYSKIFRILQDKPFSNLLLEDEAIYFKASKGASQHRYEVINED
ncbi:hypothetical protein L917_16530 [Phytophthora nicotianae]|uniref:Uncharacterized protein n=1 Tax=Phytophthora nicotianae TaxID=4792 RepID=W2KEK6_PHYNI|nr:hypothetical protein L917_16530 [Phytophthora nicotianae]